MIYGIGIDIARIERFETAYSRFGSRFPERILSADELRAFPRARSAGRYLAMRFAAKEATSKALGTGFKQGVAPRQIGVVRMSVRSPSLRNVVARRARESPPPPWVLATRENRT